MKLSDAPDTPRPSVIPLVLRRMRAPLLLLIGAYTLAITGFVLIPGQTPAGEPWRMDFLHALYFVSYTATTIGFGELPHEFTRLQRLWALGTLYSCVIGWFYALGSIIALMQEPGFRRALARNQFRRTVSRLREPFYLVCGYGDTGSLLVRAISERGRRCVVIERCQGPLDALSLEDLPLFVPGLRADAQHAESLMDAGLSHDYCAGVLAVTDDDHANLQIALTAKLLGQGLRVISRAHTSAAEENLASFGTDHVINPHHSLADTLAMGIPLPAFHAVYNALTGVPEQPLPQAIEPPGGRWILCGYGAFGEALAQRLRELGLETVIVDTQAAGRPQPLVTGRGTEAHTLREAGIGEASALVAATEDDADNLSILMTARQENPDIFLVGLQRERANHAIYQAAPADLILEASRVMARSMLSRLVAPLLPAFLSWLREQPPQAVEELAERLRRLNEGRVPHLWSVRLTERETPALNEAFARGEALRLDTLLRSPGNREHHLACQVLLVQREGDLAALPGGDWCLAPGDRLLLCGSRFARGRLNWSLCNHNALAYLLSGEQRPSGLVWRYLAKRRARRSV
ncbi:potassium channel family protein [Alkalilimnicola sp. S0819]|uniref:potassium channel family protein n=1 Tax=Alkalilimnicola sp. S0819 TaxID=2613922 RepID=UPI001262783D|nr:potassium channel protein [Alkalilimnicola sp. S0819]KAB7623361.1 potassium channel protein [Alkalilimnicola sp. S0819]MPQ16901.1 potassium transporter TrkA [Alkalilimnicola sp. S0819]